MKQFNKVMTFLVIFCAAFALSACGSRESDEFTSLQSFEYHYYPEEYEEEYSELNDSLILEADTEYQIKVNSACESGTIEIGIKNINGGDKTYIVSPSEPCRDTISIPANTTDAVSFTINIEPDTRGDVVVEILFLLRVKKTMLIN